MLPFAKSSNFDDYALRSFSLSFKAFGRLKLEKYKSQLPYVSEANEPIFFEQRKVLADFISLVKSPHGTPVPTKSKTKFGDF